MKYSRIGFLLLTQRLGYRNMQASLFPATSVAGWRAIQKDVLFPYMRKIPVVTATGSFNYFGMLVV
jgi:hypothetical protein